VHGGAIHRANPRGVIAWRRKGGGSNINGFNLGGGGGGGVGNCHTGEEVEKYHQ